MNVLFPLVEMTYRVFCGSLRVTAQWLAHTEQTCGGVNPEQPVIHSVAR